MNKHLEKEKKNDFYSEINFNSMYLNLSSTGMLFTCLIIK